MVSENDSPTGDGAAEAETAASEEGSEDVGYRIGERCLSLLATPLNYIILRSLSGGPMRLADLRRAAGLPAQTTLRGHLASLIEIGVVEKRPTDEMPYSVESALTPMGRELLEVARLLEGWLRDAPNGPFALDTGAAKGVIRAFVEGWRSTMMQGMARQPMSLTELDRGIESLSYPALERRLASMRMAGLVEARDSSGTRTPYSVTEWARRGVTPLAAAGHCEAVHLGERSAPVTAADVEAGFMMAMPLVRLPGAVRGSCLLQVELDGGGEDRPVALVAVVESGRVVSCQPGADAEIPDFLVGTVGSWVAAVGKGAPGELRLGSGYGLASQIVRGLHAALIAT